MKNDINQVAKSTIKSPQKLLQANDPMVTIEFNGQTINLARQEARCLQHLMEGHSTKETAYLMQLSTRTVETYLNNLRKKTACRSKLALICKVIANSK